MIVGPSQVIVKYLLVHNQCYRHQGEEHEQEHNLQAIAFHHAICAVCFGLDARRPATLWLGWQIFGAAQINKQT